jgi:hypothetical protein
MRQLNMHSWGLVLGGGGGEGGGRGMWAHNSLIYVFPHNDAPQVPNVFSKGLVPKQHTFFSYLFTILPFSHI